MTVRVLPGTLGSFWLKICFTVSPSPVEAAWPGGSAARASPAATTRPVSAFAARRAGKECMAGSPSVIIETDGGRTDPRGATRAPGPSSPDGLTFVDRNARSAEVAVHSVADAACQAARAWDLPGCSARGRRRPSTVQSPGAKTASANAAAAAEKTEAFKADLSPVPTAIPNANRNRRTPLRSADHRVKNPRMRAMPRTTSATVAAQASAGTVGAGAHGFTRAVYAVKRWKSPHATFAVPAGPHRPNRSATPLRKAAPSARRKKTDA